jgi:hypothetical protein
VAFLVAAAEMILRLARVVDAPFFALAVVGPSAMAVDIWRRGRKTEAVNQVNGKLAAPPLSDYRTSGSASSGSAG